MISASAPPSFSRVTDHRRLEFLPLTCPWQTAPVFGRYQILTALDAGGTGNVYRVWDIPLDRTLAFKVLAPTMAATTGVSVRHAGAPV